MDASITAAELRKSLRSSEPPLVIDVRRNERFFEAKDLIRGALRRDPAKVADWSKTLPSKANVVVYCVHGHEVSQNAAKALGAKYLEGGIEAWREMGGDLFSKPENCSSRWVTRERPKIDRIACPWLVRRFIDPGAEFLYVPAAEVKRVAEESRRHPTTCRRSNSRTSASAAASTPSSTSYLEDPALDALATHRARRRHRRLELAPQSSGLLAISQGLSMNFPDDHEMLEHGMVMYDALYAWCRSRP